MLLKIAIYLAIFFGFAWSVIPTLAAYNIDAHKKAFYKFLFIWMLSTLPVLFSIVLAPSKALSWSYIMEMSGSPFSMAEQLIFTSVFLSPVLFVFVEAIKSFLTDGDDARVRRFKHVMKSYHRVLLPSVILMSIGVLMYTSIKTDPERFKETVLYQIFGTEAIIVYVLSLVYWYCVLVIESAGDDDYVVTTQRQAANFTAAARIRIGGEK